MAQLSLNALARASSSYLRSAMHQPIQWREFGEEAFAAARAADKPVLLDIGAVWCHWCHVMDRESYEDAEIAAIVNEHYVAVKVDRDERPDIDSRYQLAVSSLTGQGGWPLTAFLTPEGKAFYGGTYFPPADSYGRPGFKRVLLSIAAAYREKNGDVMEQAKLVESAMARSELVGAVGGIGSAAGNDAIVFGIVDAIIESARKMFDPVNGGFGGAPKFPHPAALDLVMEEYARSGEGDKDSGAGDGGTQQEVRARSNDELRTIFVHTLEKMARGGVYDQLAGGFHRYSVDERWGVPHFEKMCYDNSELLKNYVHAYQATGDGFFAGVARDIIRWMDDWLSDRDRGGFYASQDADYSMDDDGDYFTWTLEELKAALTPEEATVAALHYDVQPAGDMHHKPAKNVLRIASSAGEIAGRLNVSEEDVALLLDAAQKKMYAARLQRPTPYVDKTIYAGWNAMCVSAYLNAAKILDLPGARRFALRSLDRGLAEGWSSSPQTSSPQTSGHASTFGDARADEGVRTTQDHGPRAHGLQHVIAYSDPAAERRSIVGVLDDYALTVIACLDAYEATADLSYFRFAQAIADAMIAGFFDPANGGFFDVRNQTPEGSAEKPALGILGTRRKPFQDSPTPAGNSAAAIALLRLGAYADAPAGAGAATASYRDHAERTLELCAPLAGQYGIFAATYVLAVARFLRPHSFVVVVGADSAAVEMYRTVVRSFDLRRVVLCFDVSQVTAQNLPPTLAETLPQLPALRSGRSFAVVCSGFSCQAPVFEAADLIAALADAD